MEESHDVQALEKISSEVDESQIKVILSSQCIKAQAFLLDKLKKQSTRHKETCSFISSANLKVEAEIKQAEQEIRSMLFAQETIKSANVELKKDYLLAKSKREDIVERITDGVKKYEVLWLECKTRYESIPFVRILLQAREKQKTIDQNIDNLDKQITKFYGDMEIRRKICADIDKNRCIELANYLVTEMPKTMNTMKEKSQMIHDLNKEIEQLLKEQEKGDDVKVAAEVHQAQNSNAKDDVSVGNIVPNLLELEDDSLIPKLNLENYDFDIDINLDEVKIKKDEVLPVNLTKTNLIPGTDKNDEQRLEGEKPYEYIISPYFTSYKKDNIQNFSERKLINILEDINITNNDVYNIVQKVNPQQLKAVGEISAEMVENVKMSPSCSKNKDNKPIVSEEIEEIDLTSTNAENIIIPPTQFLDITSLDGSRKKVSFDLPNLMQVNEMTHENQNIADDDLNKSENETMNNQLNASAASDESFVRIRDMLLKKHNLDLSPPFVYAKNNILLKKDDDKMITSKFFQNNEDPKMEEHDDDKMDVDEQPTPTVVTTIITSQKDREHVPSQKDTDENILVPMDLDEAIDLSRKQNKVCEENKIDRPVSGLLFTHGVQAIPDSLNVSLSTTGYEDADFPHCIDSSLLLSPKADVEANGDQEVLSQEVPNFLSGFRKTGLSFFGGPTTTLESKPDSSAQNEGNNFNFNFGGEKKHRGGLFSLFR